jgi:aminomethyltransferase
MWRRCDPHRYVGRRGGAKGERLDTKTPLYDEHVRAGARIVPFAGFLMPIHYSGIIEEHRAVRQNAGMFDLSHMGELRITGSDALSAVDRLVTNDILTLQVGQVRYTPMCYPDGGIVDDLLVYRLPDRLLLVVNAANISKDLAWIRDHLEGDACVEDVSGEVALIALQGPRAAALLQQLTEVDLQSIIYYHFTNGAVAGIEAMISRTGYTGEDGFELYVRAEDAPALWQSLRRQGEPEGLKLVGLGARDTLRLEAGYMLYGNDIDDTTSPLEAGLGWTVKFTDRDFIGRDVLDRQKTEGVSRRMVAVEMLDRSIPRAHFPILYQGEPVGVLTSGTFSPTFNQGIGLGYVRKEQARAGTDLEVEIRTQPHPVRVVRKPIYKREGA